MSEECRNIYKRARRRAGYTQEAAAEIINISVESLRAYETDRRVPSGDVVLQMMICYNCHQLPTWHLQATSTMRTTVILNLKGGVAKTATAVNLAAILASDYKKTVLLVDADSQCNATEFFGGDPVKGGLADALRHDGDGGPFAAASIQASNFPGVDLLCGSEDLMDLDLTKVELQSVRATVLREMVQRPAVRERYDYCIVDCPPAFNAASTAALIAADDVIIPIKLDAFALRGMGNLMRQIANMRKIIPSLRLSGCLPTMWYNRPLIVEAEKTLRDSGLPMYPHIRRTNKVDAMTFAQEPLLLTSPRSSAGIDYREFVREYIERGN